MSAACAVPLCPGLPVEAGLWCAVHDQVRSAAGLTYLTCTVCRRAFKPTEFLARDAPLRHLQCPPAVSRRAAQKADEPRPLLDLSERGDGV